MNYLSELEINLINKLSNKLYTENDSNLITENEIKDCQKNLSQASTKYEICSSLETLYYCFSVILSEVRQKKRETISAIFQRFPKLADEKSVLEKKLDACPEYSNVKEKEEYLFQFLEHLTNIKTYINWLKNDDE